jgi:hypothetical protein
MIEFVAFTALFKVAIYLFGILILIAWCSK